MAVRNTDAVKKWIAYIKQFENDVKEIVAGVVGDIETEAIHNAPAGGYPIKTTFGSQMQEQIARGRNWTPINQAITAILSSDGLSGKVVVEESAGEIAAWVEFGTGQDATRYLATVEPEWRDIARRFYLTGKGTIINQPYLYPAYIKNRTIFVNELKELVKRYSSK